MELSILDEQMRMSWIGEVASFHRETTANYFQVSLIQRCPHFMGMEESVFIQKKSFQGLHSVLALTCSVEPSSIPIAGLTHIDEGELGLRIQLGPLSQFSFEY